MNFSLRKASSSTSIALNTGAISEGQVIAQAWTLLLGGLGVAYTLDRYWQIVPASPSQLRLLTKIQQIIKFHLRLYPQESSSCAFIVSGRALDTASSLPYRWAGHEFPTLLVLAIFGSFISYIYSAPPLKLKQSGWSGNYALGSSYIALPWWAGQARAPASRHMPIL